MPNFTAADGSPLEEYSLSLPSLDAAGRAAFRAFINGPPGTNRGVFHEDGNGGLRQIARSGELAPGTDATFARFVGASVSDSGHVAFLGQMSGANIDASNEVGLWAENHQQQLKLVVRGGDPVPGLGGDIFFRPIASLDYFFNPQFPLYSQNRNGSVAFHSLLTGPGAIDANDRAMFVQEPTGLRIVARRGDPAPGFAEGAVFATFLRYDQTFSINDLNEVAFLASIDGTPQYEGIFSEGGGGGLQLVARIGDVVPTINATLNSFTTPRISNSGHVTFLATLSGDGVDATNNDIILTGRPGQLSIVAREGDIASAIGPDKTFVDLTNPFRFRSPVVDSRGRVFFASGLHDPAVEENNDWALWMSDEGQLTQLARKGEAAPGGGVFEYLHSGYRGTDGVAVNAHGQVAFMAYVASFGRQHLGIYAQDRLGTLQLIQSISTDSNNSLAFNQHSGGQDGWASSFNDRGELVFYRSGEILMSTRAAIPEPTAARLLAGGLLVVSASFRRRAFPF
ncbi:MAG: hypothetical protein H0T51_09770 [Pirellulales bacterium]|nr:hypothetical protein [Pirellulales bacterium]